MLLKMNFNKIIKKSTIKNHKRNRLSRISIAENNHMVIRALKKIKLSNYVKKKPSLRGLFLFVFYCFFKIIKFNYII